MQVRSRKNSSNEATVIGAGIVGICCALYLQRQGFSVTLVDREGPGEGCSMGNAGVFGVHSCVPLAMPGAFHRLVGSLNVSPPIRLHQLPKAATWLFHFLLSSRRERVEAIAIALSALQEKLVESYAPLLEAARANALIQHAGKLHIYDNSKAFEHDAPGRDLQRRNGAAFQELSAAEARELEPALGTSVMRAVYYPKVGHCVDPLALAQSLVIHFLRSGGHLLRHEVKGFEFGGDGPCSLVTEQGRIEVENVVLAAGAWSQGLARQLGSRLPLESERGYHLMIPQPELKLARPIHLGGGKVVLTPMTQGLRIAGFGELAGLRTPPNDKYAERLLSSAQKVFPHLNAHNVTRWMGHRPTMPDSLPVIGRSPRYPNVFFAFGHGRVGLALAAITGRIIAELATGRSPCLNITPYAPDRFSWS